MVFEGFDVTNGLCASDIVLDRPNQSTDSSYLGQVGKKDLENRESKRRLIGCIQLRWVEAGEIHFVFPSQQRDNHMI